MSGYEGKVYQARFVCAANAQRSYYLASRMNQEYCDYSVRALGADSQGTGSVPQIIFSSGGFRVMNLLAGTVKYGRMGKIVAAAVKRGAYKGDDAKKFAALYAKIGEGKTGDAKEDAFDAYMNSEGKSSCDELRQAFMKARPAFHGFLNQEIRNIGLEEGLRKEFQEQGFNQWVKPEDSLDILIAAADEDRPAIEKLYPGYGEEGKDETTVKILRANPGAAKVEETGTVNVKMPVITSVYELTGTDITDDPAAGPEAVRKMVCEINSLAPSLLDEIVDTIQQMGQGEGVETNSSDEKTGNDTGDTQAQSA